MARASWLGGILVVGLLLTGCAKLPWQKEEPPPAPPPVTEPVPVTVNVRELLPSGPIEWQATFDDGTATQTEAVLLSPEAIVGTQGGTPYVTWQIRPEGIYRKDAKSGSFLLYLPAELKHGLAWTQEAGGEKHWFLLTSCKDEDCWEVQVLSRNLVQRFTWAPGKWIIRAESTDLANPKNSFHKVMKGEPAPSKQVTAPEVWVDGKAPPLVAIDAAQFTEERTRRLPLNAGQ